MGVKGLATFARKYQRAISDEVSFERSASHVDPSTAPNGDHSSSVPSSPRQTATKGTAFVVDGWAWIYQVRWNMDVASDSSFVFHALILLLSSVGSFLDLSDSLWR